MEIGHLIAFNLVLLAAMASPGPALLLALRATMASGRLAGIATGAGLGTMAALWTGAGLLGLDAMFTLFPWAYVILKTGGALYLLYIAWGMWRDARQPVAAPDGNAPRLRRAFGTGFLVNLGNPKSVLFAASVLVVVFPPDLSLVEKGLIVLNHLFVEWAVYTVFALALSTATARAGYLRLKPLLDRIAAGVLALLGLRLLFSR
ncbi:LysE family translocator [Lutimaribacter sp. EGI FJ00015]|uniref:LysE family translocator n=1 Tax=Lutimaribacter degradans TaxID=2945989 RepID=A0ACC5ZTM5_9RHOB|nr:LysE family translocator [Lutimaribacter sp. EGI FJ00013]MCM2561126.1 LysE family translocator [Lutimaribacter sp. EGI FJ00013]MCO0611925.1 LysE family translocator [Lutimaribacter sp. EGI FJ00015]MCO0634954.1 LysE family translocator [Lutimaribacter sp. EGI FJ00014]